MKNTTKSKGKKIEEKIELEDCAVGGFEAVMEPCSPQPNQYDKYVSTDYPCENRWTVPHVCMPLDEFKSILTSEVESERKRLLKEVEEKVIGEDENERFLSYVSVEQTRAKNTLRAEQRKALSDIGGKGK